MSHLDRRTTHTLIARVQAGDESVRIDLIEGHMGLVFRALRRYNYKHIPINLIEDDLIQEGRLGLSRAIDGFDLERGLTFANYAIQWITNRMYRCVISQGYSIRVPCYVWQAKQKDSRPLMNENDLTVSEKRCLARWPTYEYRPPSDAGENTATQVPEDSEGPENETIGHETAEFLSEGLNALNSAEREVIGLRFGLDDHQPMNWRDIARATGLSIHCAHRIHDKAIVALRFCLTSKID